jgi:hypothetical protein
MSSNSHRRAFGRRTPRDDLEQLRVARFVARASLTEVALVSGIPRWKVQEAFAGVVQPKPAELRALRQAITKLTRANRDKRALLREANSRSVRV